MDGPAGLREAVPHAHVEGVEGVDARVAFASWPRRSRPPTIILPAPLAAQASSISEPDSPILARVDGREARPWLRTSLQDSPKAAVNLSSGTASSAGGVIVALDAMA